MKREAIIGVLLIVIGIGIFVYYDISVKPEKEAREYLVEGQIAFERGTKESLNSAINIFSKIIARYPGTQSSNDAYYYIGQSYEKLGLNRLAYLKYIYILKTENNITGELRNEIRTRIARLNIMKHYTEEGINQLLGMLNKSSNRDFRSRVYSELGHAYLKMKKYNSSKRMFDIALTENGNNEEAILGKARSYKHLGYDDLAYDLYEYFLKYYGNFSHFSKDIKKAYLSQVYQSGINNYRRGRFYPAIHFFRRLLKYFPGYRKTEDSLYWIGESFYSLQKYDSAIKYYNRVLSNSFRHRDEQARMKKGYSYFMAKRFDLAAREFQIYMNDYPQGRYIKTAKKWDRMSTKEIMYRLKDDKGEVEERKTTAKDDSDDDLIEEDDDKVYEDKGNSGSSVNKRGSSRGVRANYRSDKEINNDIKYENVAEL